MRPRTKSALLWGAVGALAFLALVQGYQFATDATVTAPAMVLVAAVVGVGAAAGAYWLEGRMGPAFVERQPADEMAAEPADESGSGPADETGGESADEGGAGPADEGGAGPADGAGTAGSDDAPGEKEQS